jgi:hypothetical protein
MMGVKTPPQAADKKSQAVTSVKNRRLLGWFSCVNRFLPKG